MESRYARASAGVWSRSLTLIFVITSLIIAACGGAADVPSDGSVPDRTPSPAAPTARSPSPEPSSSSTSLPLELTLKAPAEARAGDPVPLRLTVTNGGETALELGLGGRADSGYPASFNFFIETAGGEEVACTLCANRVPDASLSYRTFQPGEALELGWDWDQLDNDGHPVPAGTYFVRATFSALDVARNEREFELTSRPSELVIVP